MGLPLVSVIIPTYNSRPYLAEALDALATQTLPADQIEILIIDDGSTDDTWTYLTGVAAERPNVSVFTQANTGSASAGRNRGLAQATGRYVFFNDADDFLGSDALRRMTAVAETENSDVVIGHVHRFGRATAHRPSNTTVMDADLIDDGVRRSLSPHKLFRRSLIDRLQARFPEDQVFGEDQVFVATCLFAADKVTMLGDYDFYHRRAREDLGNLSARVPQTLVNKSLTTTRMTRLVVDHTEPGRRRDALLRRVLTTTLPGALHVMFARSSEADRADFLETMRAEVFPHLTERLLRLASPWARFRLLTARDGTADDLLALIPVLDRPWRYLVADSVLCYDLGARHNALIGVAERRVREDFEVPHEVVSVAPAATGLRLGLRLAAGPASAQLPFDRVEVRARSHAGPWHDVDAADVEAGLVTLTVGPAAETAPVEQRWTLRIRGYAQGAVVGQSLLGFPSSDGAPEMDRRASVRGPVLRWRLKLYVDDGGHAKLHLRPLPVAETAPTAPTTPPRSSLRSQLRTLLGRRT